MSELNSEQVIKVLEHCGNDRPCRKCELHELGNRCIGYLAKNCLSLIDEVKADTAREIFAEIEEGIKSAISALQFENNPIHRNVKHTAYSSLMCFIKTIEQKHTEERE